MNKSNNITQVILLITLFLFGFNFAQASEHSNQIVKVGWFKSPYFQEGMSDSEEKSGYCYDYLQSISAYTTWHYKYVYGDLNTLLKKLEKGEIDLLGGIVMTEERKKTISFPNTPMGFERYGIYKHNDDRSISALSVATFNGKKIGIIANSPMKTIVEQWQNDNHIKMNVVAFNGIKEQRNAFENGKVDIIVETLNEAQNMRGITLCAKIGQEAYFLAVSKRRTDLVAGLNNALMAIQSVDPFLVQKLQSTHFVNLYSNEEITETEKRWIETHKTITVGYMDHYLPYCDQDEDGNAIGLMSDVLKGIFESLNITNKVKIIYKPYENYVEMTEALQKNTIDAAFPVMGNLWNLDQEHIDGSLPVVSCNEMFFYKDTFDKDNIKAIAVNENNLMQIAYCKRNFPNAKLYTYPSIEGCLDAILDDEVDGTIVNSLRSELVTGNSKYKKLSSVLLSKNAIRCFGFNEENNTLLLLFNRGISAIGPSYGIDNSYKYTGRFINYTASDFIKDNIQWVALFSFILVVAIVSVLVYGIRRLSNNVKKIHSLNDALKQSQAEAESANKSKTNFLFNMSHDIRTPMNAIIGFSEIMEKELNDPEKLKAHLSKVKDSSTYLLSLINDVLEVARIDSGKENVNEKFTDLKNDDCRVDTLLEFEIKKKDLHFTKSMNIQHQYVFADMKKIREITMNILSNAIKYTPNGGSIQMSFDEVPSNKEGYATYINTITDTGIGISEEFQKHIFESFSRERNTTESKIQGTGLGMSIVKKLATMMGGDVEVESTEGKGSTFRVILTHKIVDNPESYLQENTETETSTVDFTGKRILLVEDNEFNAEIATTILESMGLTIEIAEDGLKCLDKINLNSADYYNLIFMDIQMPKMNGYQATQAIRLLEDKAKATIPIVAMTANAFEEDKQAALSSGMNGHLAKPINIPELTKILKKYL